MKIKVLDKFIADKIAAGEVIERPLSIVKELVENSIDANSTRITVELKNGGKTYIRVTDNGIGIPSEDVSTAFLRHATGKISNLEDLDKVETLGFRGEALASIAAVSRVTIFTKTKDEILGTKVILHAGKEVYHDAIGVSNGTSFVVEDVFYNTPARRKFMKSDGAEASSIIDFVERMALFYSNISFRLINNGKDVFKTSGNSDVRATIESVYPIPEFKGLIEVNSDKNITNNFGIKVKGYISNPATTKKTRKYQIAFVNGRIVSSKIIDNAIDKGYGDRVFTGFPIAILFIEINPELIDVNIHPSKKEIKFLYEKSLIDVVSEAISSSMELEKSVPELTISTKVNAETPGGYSFDRDNADVNILPDTDKGIDYQLDLKNFLQSKREEECSVVSENKLNKFENKHENNHVKQENSNIFRNRDEFIKIEESGDGELNKLDFENLNVTGYLFNTYIITSYDDCVYVIDQHAAHERINYERLIKSYNEEAHIAQPIITPFTITVPSSVYNGDTVWKTTLERLGFEFEDFGNKTYKFRGIPSYMSVSEARSFVQTFLDELDVECQLDLSKNGSTLNRGVVDKLIMKSCKMSVKGGDKLSILEIKELIREMGKCINPFSCPHGRPTIIKISKYEIERAFKRK